MDSKANSPIKKFLHIIEDSPVFPVVVDAAELGRRRPGGLCAAVARSARPRAAGGAVSAPWEGRRARALAQSMKQRDRQNECDFPLREWDVKPSPLLAKNWQNT